MQGISTFFKKSIISKHLLYLLIIIIYYTLFHLVLGSCPIKLIFGISCPTCGTTRSLLALLKLDFSGYWHFHPAGIFVFFGSLIGIHMVKMDKFITRWVTRFSFYFMILIIIITYILRIFTHTLP